MDLLRVEGLSKHYQGFQLDDVSFALPAGYIMGFVGRNGAGKTTTLKAMLNLVRPQAGAVTILGKDYFRHELELKPSIGLMLGGATYYPQTRLARLSEVFASFFETWDEQTYRSYLARFELDERKKVSQLSAGMKVKYALALALSHDARLLVLDEPTSGLDPVSRDDLVDLFRELIEAGERSILFSTQITSDLEKCADYITYIRQGRLVASAPADEFVGAYRLVRGTKDQLTSTLQAALVGYKLSEFGFTGLIPTADQALASDCLIGAASIEEIMVYHERRPSAASDQEEKK